MRDQEFATIVVSRKKLGNIFSNWIDYSFVCRIIELKVMLFKTYFDGMYLLLYNVYTNSFVYTLGG